MNLVAILLVFLVSSPIGIACNTTYIAECLNQFVDLNADSKISADELDNYMYATPCGLPFSLDYSGDEVVELFDTNADGFVDASDINYNEDAENGRASLFLRFEQVLTAACQECDRCHAMVLTPPAR